MIRKTPEGNTKYTDKKIEPESRHVTKQVLIDYRSALNKLEAITYLNKNDVKSLKLLVTRFRHDLSTIKVHPKGKGNPASLQLMLSKQADTRTRRNLRNAVKWRSWDNKPRIYVIYRQGKSPLPLREPNAPESEDIAGILLQWRKPMDNSLT